MGQDRRKVALIPFLLISVLLVAGFTYLELTSRAGVQQTSSSSSQSFARGPLIELYPPSVYVVPGQSENYTSINVYPPNANFTGTYSIQISGLAPGLSANLSSTPSDMPFGERSYELTLAASQGLPPGTYKMTVESASGPNTVNASALLSFEVNPNVVFMNNYRYYPSNLTVMKGSAVIWFNLQGLDVFLDDYGIHDVAFNTSGLISPNILQYGSWSLTFNNAGTYSYYCTIHPYMKGIIIVKG